MLSLQFAISRCVVAALVSHCCKEMVSQILAALNIFCLVSNDGKNVLHNQLWKVLHKHVLKELVI